MAHVVGGLSLEEGRRFRSHLLECTSCRARVGELRAIAHDLADVERDERRQRATSATDTKTSESAEEEPPPAPPRLSGRMTLMITAGLLVLMALSAWNFILRGRLQDSAANLELLGSSVTTLENGDRWQELETTSPAVDGAVATDDQGLVVLVDGLGDSQRYGLYLLGDADEDEVIRHEPVEATAGVAFTFVPDRGELDVDQVQRVLLTRDSTQSRTPSGTTVFEAVRPVVVPDVEVTPAGASVP